MFGHPLTKQASRPVVGRLLDTSDKDAGDVSAATPATNVCGLLRATTCAEAFRAGPARHKATSRSGNRHAMGLGCTQTVRAMPQHATLTSFVPGNRASVFRPAEARCPADGPCGDEAGAIIRAGGARNVGQADARCQAAQQRAHQGLRGRAQPRHRQRKRHRLQEGPLPLPPVTDRQVPQSSELARRLERGDQCEERGSSRLAALRGDQIFAQEWTTAGILEAAKGFARLKRYKHLPALRAELAVHQSKCVSKRVEDNADVA
jgi:hypothetical protein